ncbi:sensor histidine kinase regulating citrate/malate metabolism [Paenibacillus endophyticus]|uniref:Sensor histidine kinase regulating citrate/malate metabolism n=1 Tax=Paenibacillus endophyticus TaxID=1294268 RepID=A0A7W5C382_9BACL|nr:Spo0B domain-containing protein [Paenibacillus endophyticus]MBB3150193.1 sensor histidine kinase regulating citrate/malate metabolism [Paenibacillus endophyticus]
MGRLTKAKYYAAGTVILPCAAVFIWPTKVWLTAVFLVWLLAVATYWIRTERKEHAERTARTILSLQGSAIRTLNHHRHDWMNDLQVVFGYIRLKKLDKAAEFVGKISERMAVESQISKLGVPSLISYIQSFRTISNSLELQLVIIGDIHLNELTADADQIAETLIHTINAYRFAAKPGYGNAAVLTLELSLENDTLSATFFYDGELMNEQQWKQKIQQQLEGAPMQPVNFEQPYAKVLLRAEMRA